MCQEIEDPAAGGYDDLDDLDDADYELEKSYECVCPSYWHQFNHGTNDHICERGLRHLGLRHLGLRHLGLRHLGLRHRR